MLYRDDGEVHPRKLVDGLLARSGATLYPHHEVRTLEQTADGVRVHTSERTFEAGAIVLATNGYSADLHPFFADKIYPTRGQIIMTAPVAPFMVLSCVPSGGRRRTLGGAQAGRCRPMAGARRLHA